MEIIYGNEKDFDNVINDNLVLVDFFANWCGPCKMLGPILEEISNDREDIKIVKIDVDENEQLARQYGIMSIPTLKIFKNGNEIDTHNGYMNKDELLEWINKDR